MSEEARIKVYSRHNCQRKHQSFAALAKCIWRRAEWISGNGAYATLAHCRVLTVELHQTLDTARQAKAAIDSTACGGRCYGRHELVQLADPMEAKPW